MTRGALERELINRQLHAACEVLSLRSLSAGVRQKRVLVVAANERTKAQVYFRIRLWVRGLMKALPVRDARR